MDFYFNLIFIPFSLFGIVFWIYNEIKIKKIKKEIFRYMKDHYFDEYRDDSILLPFGRNRPSFYRDILESRVFRNKRLPNDEYLDKRYKILKKYIQLRFLGSIYVGIFFFVNLGFKLFYI
ncbi:MAG: hypothetical protein JXM74_04540 [Fusobacteriaceae bacterium]|nr:hypothetical protein [Fusobacteriaceae bacterium]